MLEKLFARQHIEKLDLHSVRAKAAEQLGWSEEQARHVEHEYRRFLFALAHKHKDEMISPPNQEVDEFWHQHILDTRKYREDCATIFGHYIDHTPGLSTANQSRADARRREIYRDYSIDGISFDSDSSSSSSHSSHSHSSHDCHDAGAHGHGAEAGGHADGGHAGDSCDSGSGGDGGGGGGGGGCGGGGCGGGCGGG